MCDSYDFNGGDMSKGNKCFTVVILNFSLIITLALFQAYTNAQEKNDKPPHLDIAEKILKKGLQEEGAYAILKKIASVGPRLTGSPQAAAAVRIMYQEMSDLGFDDVHLEPTWVGRWIRGEEEQARLVSSQIGSIPLSICAIGGSIATPKTGISAQVVEAHSFQELQKMKDKINGKLVFFNRPMDPTLFETFMAYGEAADQRVSGAAEAAKLGAVAVLVRSLTQRIDDFPHTGLMRYESDIPQIPAACISTKGADLLSELLKKDPDLNVYIRLDCKRLSPVTSYNVVAQLTGTEKPNEIILLGGHLDSWDLGTGAHDDGAGCAHAVEALRLIDELKLRPKRTIRAVMFMDEEFGGTGGRDYARSNNRKDEVHLAAIESDRGGFAPRGFGIGAEPKTVEHLQGWQYLFEPLGTLWIRQGGGGVDIAPLAKQGTITIGLVPEFHSYFDYHHSGRDVLEAVNPRELELGAIAMAIFSYVMAQEGVD
jgi:carboxypeptidase Q